MGFLTRCKRLFSFAFLLQNRNTFFSFFLKSFLILSEKQHRLVREISGIANNINQITRLANTVKSVSPAQVEELQRLCSEALSLVKESL